VPADEPSKPDEVTCGSATESTLLLLMGMAAAGAAGAGAVNNPLLPGMPCEVPSKDVPSEAAGCGLGLPHALTGAAPMFSELG